MPAESKIAGLKDLDGMEVAVQQGTTLEKNIAAAAPNAKVTAFKDYNSAWLALAQGRVDALTGSLNILQGFQKNNPKFKIVGDMFSVEPFGIGVRKGDSDLRDAINADAPRALGLRRIHGPLSQIFRYRSDHSDRGSPVSARAVGSPAP